MSDVIGEDHSTCNWLIGTLANHMIFLNTNTQLKTADSNLDQFTSKFKSRIKQHKGSIISHFLWFEAPLLLDRNNGICT